MRLKDWVSNPCLRKWKGINWAVNLSFVEKYWQKPWKSRRRSIQIRNTRMSHDATRCLVSCTQSSVLKKKLKTLLIRPNRFTLNLKELIHIILRTWQSVKLELTVDDETLNLVMKILTRLLHLKRVDWIKMKNWEFLIFYQQRLKFISVRRHQCPSNRLRIQLMRLIKLLRNIWKMMNSFKNTTILQFAI